MNTPVFRVSSSPLDPSGLRRLLDDPRAGAFATFEGCVRDLNEGRPVSALDYEAYLPLAEKEGARILEEALARFRILRAVCAHRTGRLGLGDLAVWVGVSAEHREAAFGAARYVIDKGKARLPIWKREHYREGPSAWINCATRGEAMGLDKP